MNRPWGFAKFTKREGFHSIYLITTENDSPVKVGIAADPKERFNHIQAAHFLPLRLHRFWWVPGRPISKRVEDEFKEHFKSHNVRGEWFNLPLPEAEVFIEHSIAQLRTWGVPEIDVVELLDHRERRHFSSFPNDAPSPLRGLPDDWRPRSVADEKSDKLAKEKGG